MSKLRSLSVISSVLLAVVGLAVAGGKEERSIGFVLEMVGNWTADGTVLRLGQAVAPGAEIRAVRGNRRQAPGYVALVLLDSKVIRIACTKDKACEPYKLPASLVKSSSLLERVSEAAVNLFGARPERYTPTITRSDKDTSERFLETVVRLQGGKLSLEPLMRGLPDGEYALSFHPASQTEPGAAGIPIALRWQAGSAESPVTAEQLSRGLYSVTVRTLAESDESCKTENAWTLVVAGKDYDQASADLQQVRAGINSWQGVSEAGKRSFLRVSLEVLAGEYK